MAVIRTVKFQNQRMWPPQLFTRSKAAVGSSPRQKSSSSRKGGMRVRKRNGQEAELTSMQGVFSSTTMSRVTIPRPSKCPLTS